MAVTISRKQRNALYRLILDDLSAFGDLQAAYDGSKQIEDCYRLGRRIVDGLRLIQDGGVGWGDDAPGGPVELTLPAEELRGILRRQSDLLIAFKEASRADREETESEWRLDDEALTACEDALRQISGESGLMTHD